MAFTPVALAAFLGGGAAAGAGTTAIGSATSAAAAVGRRPGASGSWCASTTSTVSRRTTPPPAAAPPPLPAPPSLPPPRSLRTVSHRRRVHRRLRQSAPPPAPAEPTADPPRRAYARIECDDAVVVETVFDLIVGLSPTPVSGVVGPALIRPPSSVGDYELTAHVVADGFELAPGETWSRTMLVSARRRIRTSSSISSLLPRRIPTIPERSTCSTRSTARRWGSASARCELSAARRKLDAVVPVAAVCRRISGCTGL